MDHESQTDTTLARGRNPFLGELLCYSCRTHNKFSSPVDKVFLFDRHFLAQVDTGGEFRILQGIDQTDNAAQQAQEIVEQMSELTKEDLMPFGDGVRLSFRGTNLECSTCGSHEFCKLVGHEEPLDLIGLEKRMAGLRGRVLYFEQKGSGCRSSTYLHFDRLWARGSSLFFYSVDSSEPHPAIENVSNTVSWFNPDPSLPEEKLERLIQRRIMKPLEIFDSHGCCATVYIVPQKALKRPENKYSRWWIYGEPWCHKCNPTFFWDPDTEPVAAVRNGCGLRCCECHMAMPN